jgi:rubrerythrin
MKKYICSVCGYVHEGTKPPEICPICGVSSDKFVEASAQK